MNRSGANKVKLFLIGALVLVCLAIGAFAALRALAPQLGVGAVVMGLVIVWLIAGGAGSKKTAPPPRPPRPTRSADDRLLELLLRSEVERRSRRAGDRVDDVDDAEVMPPVDGRRLPMPPR